MQEQGPSRLPLGDNKIWAKDEDDWLGVTNQQERRRIQNRRNQRALQERGHLGRQIRRRRPTARYGFRAVLAGQSHDSQWVEITEATIQVINLVRILEPSWEGNQKLTQGFESFATRSYTARIGALSFLPSVSQYNFIKALFANMAVLGLSDEEMDNEALSPFNRGPHGPSRLPAGRAAGGQVELLPTALQPTELQRATMHHPWIDLLPMPAMRENIFRRDADSFDEEELCHAMRGQAPVHNPGLLVWRDPWDPTGWEVTEDFVASWPWVVVGCADLLRSTNAWRARRGERALFRSSP
ncbi:hypothetical protein INS49_005713 [Diaporthe citri]|uniref:uncharacterized protein n=1 Tax=Diaporthe citri TaxID=83186 RepID=UPI001C81CF12|nr:uncharacterized protein INS49_005713 [Diaporthe citri]KAG6364115.1 hypothetical protein INS49_005713 [Diaporthe citri]